MTAVNLQQTFPQWERALQSAGDVPDVGRTVAKMQGIFPMWDDTLQFAENIPGAGMVAARFRENELL